MAGYIGSKTSVVSSGVERKKTYSITGSTTSLTGLNYTVGKVHVYQNGVRLLDGTDYTATNGTSITLTVAAQSGDNVVVVSQASFQLSEHYTSAEADAEFVTKTGDTMSGNLNITGTVTADGLTVDGAYSQSKASGTFFTLTDTTNSKTGYINWDSGNWGIFTHGPYKRLNIADNGDISFYEDTGTTAKFFWDSSTERLGLGTSSPDQSLVVADATGVTTVAINNLRSNVGDVSSINFRHNSITGSQIKSEALEDFSVSANRTSDLQFWTRNNGTILEAMRIDASGNVGIGTSSPSSWAKLDILGTGGLQNGATQALQVRSPSTTAGEGVGIRLNAASGSHEAVGIIGMVNNASGNAGSMTFHTYNGGATIPERMRIDSSGRVTMPYQPAFTAYQYDTDTGDEYPITSNEGTLVANSTALNRGSIYNDNNGRFTAPVAGVYHITFNLSLYSTGIDVDNSVGWGLYVNGSRYLWTTYTSALAVTQSTPWVIGDGNTSDQDNNLTSATEIGAPHYSANISLSQNDYVQVGWKNLSQALGVRSFIFSGHLIG